MTHLKQYTRQGFWNWKYAHAHAEFIHTALHQHPQQPKVMVALNAVPRGHNTGCQMRVVGSFHCSVDGNWIVIVCYCPVFVELHKDKKRKI